MNILNHSTKISHQRERLEKQGRALGSLAVTAAAPAASGVTIKSRPPLCIHQDLKEIADNILGPCFGMTVRMITSRGPTMTGPRTTLHSGGALWSERSPTRLMCRRDELCAFMLILHRM
ncbi:hypothetical protein WA026_015928 [Henosepilachna vigintioctopunctata]|uniref:Uncharacterized protein n=1 Tax=Henosepilachna vigintioctopunctata TaxID=420089 RepID=A0AAW1U8D2_9CUCU